MERELSVVQVTTCMESFFKRARGLPQITKRLTMCIFLHRCVGLRVDRGALSANARTEKDFWVQVRGRR
jgi:hypothetical protein